jgi:lysophospholipase L1-like esterase
MSPSRTKSPTRAQRPTREELDARFNVYSRLFTHQDPSDESFWSQLHDMPKDDFIRLVRSIHADVVGEASSIVDEVKLAPYRARLPRDEKDRVLALGDSITSDRGSWFEILSCVAELVGTRSHWINSGTSGDSSTHALGRFDRAVTALEPTHVVIALGTNDSRRNNSGDGVRLVSTDEYSRNLRAILALCEAHGAQATLLSPPPVDPQMIEAWHFEENLHWSNSDIAETAEMTRAVAQAVGCEFINLYEAFPEPSGQHHLPDGLHPNRRGQGWIARQVLANARWGADRA